MNNKLSQQIDKLGRAIENSADAGGSLSRAIHAAAFKKSLANKIHTDVGHFPAGFVAQRAMENVFKIKTK